MDVKHVSICIFIVLFLLEAKASIISFQAYPSTLKANLTDTASMRCSLADTDTTSGQIGKRSVESTTNDILHISSIHVLTNQGQEVASITPFDPATALVDLGNLEVKGDVSGTDSTGYLELTWKDATSMTLGEYVCEIETIDAKHKTVEFTSSLEISAVAPTVNDVILEFKSKLLRQEQKISALEQKMNQDVGKLKSCTSHRVSFMAVISTFPLAGGHEDTVAVNKPVVFDKMIYSMGGGYDATTGLFTCTEPGVYFFSVHSISYFKENICLNLKLNNQTVTSLHALDYQMVDTGSTSAVLHLKANDVVMLETAPGCTAEFFSDGNVVQANVFTGHMTHSDDCL